MVAWFLSHMVLFQRVLNRIWHGSRNVTIASLFGSDVKVSTGQFPSWRSHSKLCAYAYPIANLQTMALKAACAYYSACILHVLGESETSDWHISCTTLPVLLHPELVFRSFPNGNNSGTFLEFGHRVLLMSQISSSVYSGFGCPWMKMNSPWFHLQDFVLFVQDGCLNHGRICTSTLLL